MTRGPTGESRGDRISRWLFGLGIIIVLLSVVSSSILLYEHNNDLHAIARVTQTIRNGQIQSHGTLATLKSLQQQVAGVIIRESAVINQLPAADAELGQFAAYTIAVNEAVCGDIVIVAKASGLTLTPCPIVPKFAPLSSPSASTG